MTRFLVDDRTGEVLPDEEIVARARARAAELMGLVWHVGSFLIVNAFIWLLDLATGAGGVQWAHWVSVAWGFGLAFHLLTFVVQGRDIEARAARRYLARYRETTTTQLDEHPHQPM